VYLPETAAALTATVLHCAQNGLSPKEIAPALIEQLEAVEIAGVLRGLLLVSNFCLTTRKQLIKVDPLQQPPATIEFTPRATIPEPEPQNPEGRGFDLAPLQIQIMTLLAAEVSQSDIEQQCALTSRSFTNHLRFISRKVGVSNLLQLNELARKHFSPKASGTPSVLSVIITARQHEILGLMGRGLTTNLIAERLGLSPSTVYTHIHALYRIMKVDSQLQAVLKGRQLGLIEGG